MLDKMLLLALEIAQVPKRMARSADLVLESNSRILHACFYEYQIYSFL